MKKKKYDPLKHVAKTGALLSTETFMLGMNWNIVGSIGPGLPHHGGQQMVRAMQTGSSLTGIPSLVHGGAGVMKNVGNMFSGFDIKGWEKQLLPKKKRK